MRGKALPANVKRSSALRRVPPLERIRYLPMPGGEGDLCAFRLPVDALPITIEAPSGRMMAVAPGDVFLGTPGYRAATRSMSGRIPDGGLVPGKRYWVLAASGVVGEPIGGSPFDEAYIGSVRYLGAVCTDNGERLNIRQFAVKGTGGSDCGAPVFLILGTSGEVGKTTAGIALVRMLRLRGHETVVALKATGSCSVEEIASYEDFGAAQALDCLDFGLPGTYPIGRDGIGEFFASALDFCLALPADAVVIECGSDLSNPNVREFLDRLIARRPDPRITLAAADALGALAAKQLLLEMGLSISLITGPCADTPALRERTSALCGVPTISLVRRSEGRTRFDMSALTA